MDDHAFCILNNGTPTYCSHSYDSRDAFDVAFVYKPRYLPSCSWTVLDSVGSDHSPVLIEFSHTHKTPNSKMLSSGILKKLTGGCTNPPWIIPSLGQCPSVILTANGSFSTIQY
ncbi:hypothetical protein TNCT_513421 [Trichonephila clavata]|uniref:Endonuclease/exonuclease/phosphatase domain-containing protein n=1 Tax=Trichonephila clavata TaxID=2740835 RepID=A0A8X6G9X8_TRICU|nr:hypothetical protein TNCT_513421 [Trichonephila clavata]